MGLTGTIRRTAFKAIPFLAAAAFACTDKIPTAPRSIAPLADSVPSVDSIPPVVNTMKEITELYLTTPDGTNNLLHPSLLCNDTNCFLLASQHALRTGSATRTVVVENTVGYKSSATDLLSWSAMNNPIFSADEIDSTVNASDPELLDLKPKLAAYSRIAFRGFDALYVKETSDTLNWSAAREVLRGPSNSLISPTVLKNANEYVMWTIDAGINGCNSAQTIVVRRRSRTYDDFTHARTDTTDLNENSVPGMVLWHIEMIRGPTNRPDSIIALVAMHPSGAGCSNSSLYMGTTVDGKHFTMHPRPVRTGGDSIFSMVYRSTGVYKNGILTIIFSGMKNGGRPEAKLAIADFNYDSLSTATLRGTSPAPQYLQNPPLWFTQSEGRH